LNLHPACAGVGDEFSESVTRLPSKVTFVDERECRTMNRVVRGLSAGVLFYSAAFADEPDERVEKAKAFVSQMAAGEFDKAVGPFDATMSRVLPATKLAEIWSGVVKQYGALQQATDTRTERVQQYTLVFVTCEFERGKLDTKVVFNTKGEIGGLFFVPCGKYQRPGYVDPTKFVEEEISIGKGVMRLPGTLSVPTGNVPFPAIVLVHGSGPNDRDQTIGPNKPFRDLAHGLASRGIAVLRYEKRTKQHPILMSLTRKSVTVKEETIDDAVAAVEALKSHNQIDPNRIFLLGHSLGGMLIPRIAKAEAGIAGFISLAGSTRPLEDLALQQRKYIWSLDGETTEDEKAKIQELEEQVARVKSPDLTPSMPAKDFPLGIPASYWLDLRGYDPAKEAGSLPQPMLVLQGERDYQVTMEDFAGWKKALAGRDDVKFISYPHLNHLFVEGEGKSTPQEYSSPGNVASVVIEDIVKWCAEHTQAKR
jgi:dienelactone hydrolase